MIYYFKKYPLAIAIIAIICYLSFFSPPKTNLQEVTNIDKIAHFLMYGGLCVVLWYENLKVHKKIKWKHIVIGAIIAPIAMSGTIEIMQAYLTNNRSGEWSDFIANVAGVFFATIFGYYIIKPFFNMNNR